MGTPTPSRREKARSSRRTGVLSSLPQPPSCFPIFSNAANDDAREGLVQCSRVERDGWEAIEPRPVSVL